MTLRQKLEGPLKEEKRRGYTDKAVLGGLAGLIQREINSDLKGDENWITFLRKFEKYGVLSPGQRKDLIESLEKRLSDNPQTSSLAKGIDTEVFNKSAGIQSDPVPKIVGPKEQIGGKDFLTGLGLANKSRAMALSRLGLRSVDDLILRPPRFVLHRDLITPISQSFIEKDVMIAGLVDSVDTVWRGRMSTLKVKIRDGSGLLDLVFFNMPYLKDRINPGQVIVASGRVEKNARGSRLQGTTGNVAFLAEAEWAKIESGGLVLRYHTTPTLTQPFMEELISSILPRYLPSVVETLVHAKLQKDDIPMRREALVSLHKAQTIQQFEAARRRLAYDELLVLQTYLGIRKRARAALDKERVYKAKGPKLTKFLDSLPFSLTGAQKRVMTEIETDLNLARPMNRLLQGDVGSGKTVVATAGLVIAAQSGFQAAMIAPTEILALQHERTLRKMLRSTGIRMVRLTGGVKAKEGREIRSLIRNGEADVVVGTHALLEEKVQFKNLAFVVMDERHKFGVRQREVLEAKGNLPDALMMTATPFPRALVLTLYGDTDLSILDEIPEGRGHIPTRWAGMSKREEIYKEVRREVESGGQAYIVFPLVESSAKLAARAAIDSYKELNSGYLAGLKLGLIHGRLPSKEKDDLIEAFRGGSIQVLVSTTVVEVGMDVPEATVMVVENAERFGLSQLHQLRGRIGRGSRPARCMLVSGPRVSSEARQRLKAMIRTNDGFRLAEEDLRLRGPGELLGTRQHGLGMSQIVDLGKDTDYLELAREEAMRILEEDPELSHPDNKFLRKTVVEEFKDELKHARFS